MFIMSVSLSSALQRCTVCFYKGVRIWMGAWVLVWCRGGGEEGRRGAEPNMLFIKDERRESFYCLRRLFMLSVRVCVCVRVFTWKRNLPLTPSDLCLPGGSSMWCDGNCMPFLLHQQQEAQCYWLASFHPGRCLKGNVKDNLRSFICTYFSLKIHCMHIKAAQGNFLAHPHHRERTV